MFLQQRIGQVDVGRRKLGVDMRTRSRTFERGSQVAETVDNTAE